MLNRKGNIAPGLLVLLALFLVILTLFGFAGFNNEGYDEGKRFTAVIDNFDLAKISVKDALYFLANEARIANTEKTGTEFESAFNLAIKNAAEQRREEWKDKTNLMGLLFNQEAGSYSLNMQGDDYDLIIRDVWVKITNGNDELSGTYDFKVTFNKDKILKIEETAK